MASKPRTRKKSRLKAGSKAKSKPKTKSKSKVAAKAKARVKAGKRTATPKAKAKPQPSPIPAGYGTLQPYLIVNGAGKAIAYYKSVFGARERMRMAMPNGRIGHAELQIGGAVVMLADEAPAWNAHGPRKFGGSPVSIMMYVKDVDATVKKAVAAGGRITREVKDQFYGDRSGGVEDPFGHHWHIATHVEDVSPKEMSRRMKEAMQHMPPPKPESVLPEDPKQPLSPASPAHPAPESPEAAERST